MTSSINTDSNPFCGYCSNPVHTPLCKCFYDRTPNKKKKVIHVQCAETRTQCKNIVGVADDNSDGYCPHHNILLVD